jgi:Fe-S-cluster containining protein
MKPWIELDQDLVGRVRQMVVDSLAAARNLKMALEPTRQAMHWSDRLLEAFEAANPLPRPVACQPGCTFCCHNQVEATPTEVFIIAQMIRLYSPPQKQEILKEKTLRTAALKVGKSKAELAAARETLPCPLLEGDKCAIYPWRPLTCRAMHALNREHCQASFAAGDLSGEEYYLHRYVFPLSLSAGLLGGFGAMGCQARVLDLTAALAQVLLEPTLAERWLAGEEVFK